MSRAAILLLACLAGCADARRVVQPVTWHEIPSQELHDVCQNWDPAVRGCVLSGKDGDRIYTLPVVRP